MDRNLRELSDAEIAGLVRGECGTDACVQNASRVVVQVLLTLNVSVSKYKQLEEIEAGERSESRKEVKQAAEESEEKEPDAAGYYMAILEDRHGHRCYAYEMKKIGMEKWALGAKVVVPGVGAPSSSIIMLRPGNYISLGGKIDTFVANRTKVLKSYLQSEQ